jgi:hypothetical protein
LGSPLNSGLAPESNYLIAEPSNLTSVLVQLQVRFELSPKIHEVNVTAGYSQREDTNMQTQHAQHHATSPLPVRVDVRLCGGIPRKDMKDQLFIKDNGARCSLSALTSPSETSLNISCLAAANGPTSDCSTHRTIAVCDALSGLVMHNNQNITTITNNNNNMLQTIENNLQKSTPLAPLMDVPSWAVPARGESRLEVSLMLLLLHS